MLKLKLAMGLQSCDKDKQELYLKEMKLIECCQNKEPHEAEEESKEEVKGPIAIKM